MHEGILCHTHNHVAVVVRCTTRKACRASPSRGEHLHLAKKRVASGERRRNGLQEEQSAWESSSRGKAGCATIQGREASHRGR